VALVLPNQKVERCAEALAVYGVAVALLSRNIDNSAADALAEIDSNID